MLIAWIEGFAIMVAVVIVASVGSFVDWKKEVQFVKSRKKSDEKNVVSTFPPLLKSSQPQVTQFKSVAFDSNKLKRFSNLNRFNLVLRPP